MSKADDRTVGRQGSPERGQHNGLAGGRSKGDGPRPLRISAILGLAAVALVIVGAVGANTASGPWIPAGIAAGLGAVYAVARAIGKRWVGAVSGLTLALGLGSFFVFTTPSTINITGLGAVAVGANGTAITALAGK